MASTTPKLSGEPQDEQPCCPTEHMGHLGWEISTQAEAESRGQPQTCEPNYRRQWFPGYLVCCHSPAPGFWHAAPAAGSLLVSQCCSLRVLGGEDKAAPTQGWSKRDTFPKGWMLFLTQKDTHSKHVTTCLTLLDTTIKRQHMVSGGQDTQPPLDGGEGTTVQERWELVLPVFETLVLIPRASQKACISCSASLLAWEPTKAVMDTPGRMGAWGG